MTPHLQGVIGLRTPPWASPPTPRPRPLRNPRVRQNKREETPAFRDWRWRAGGEHRLRGHIMNHSPRGSDEAGRRPGTRCGHSQAPGALEIGACGRDSGLEPPVSLTHDSQTFNCSTIEQSQRLLSDRGMPGAFVECHDMWTN